MKRPRILAVDDEPVFTEILRQYFEIRGFDIDTAPGRDGAMALFTDNKYDVILLDFKMKGPDGDAVMREMRKKDKNVPIIFITGYGDVENTKRMVLEEGAYAYIEKPLPSLKFLENLVVFSVMVEHFSFLFLYIIN